MTETPAPAVLTELRDHVLVVTLNRPEARNAVNAELTQGLGDALERAEQRDRDPRGRADRRGGQVVLRRRGPQGDLPGRGTEPTRDRALGLRRLREAPDQQAGDRRRQRDRPGWRHRAGARQRPGRRRRVREVRPAGGAPGAVRGRGRAGPAARAAAAQGRDAPDPDRGADRRRDRAAVGAGQRGRSRRAGARRRDGSRGGGRGQRSPRRPGEQAGRVGEIRGCGR